MSTLTKIIVSSILAIFLSSCVFENFGVNGNGNVVSKERTLNGTFNEIKVSRGLDVYLTQANSTSIKVQADENLHDIIKTEVKDNVLKIYAKENIASSAAKKIMVNFNNVSKIESTSGSDVFSNNTIQSKELELSATSGSDMELSIETQTLVCDASSGADMELSGKTRSLIAKASSGSEIDTENLSSETAQVKASSGAGVSVNTSKKITASASSGGDITYYGNPEIVEKNDNVSGSIRKR
ncbi:head GIN domain-containing protein [Mangrovimonas cancribranchiae]|uniref:Head GIN domain-containing protein n=1 Tax=Mangrovimonas cancribranchiae TaxID=3080055 RepID=A0AAU6P499_9FLAO